MDEVKELKQRILGKASEMFGKYGFSNVKTEELASEIGISKRTLYEQYPSKKALLDDIVDSILCDANDRVYQVIKNITEDENSNFLEELKKLWNLNTESYMIFRKAFLDDIKKSSPQTWSKIKEFREYQIKQNFEKISSIGVKRGLSKPHINDDILFLLYINAINNILNPDILSELPHNSKDVVNQIFEILLTGSLTEEGRKLYEDMRK